MSKSPSFRWARGLISKNQTNTNYIDTNNCMFYIEYTDIKLIYNNKNLYQYTRCDICRGCLVKPQSHQAYDQVTTYLRPKNGSILERTYDWSQRSYDWSQRSWVIGRGKSVAARSWSCSTPSHTGLTTRLRPTCDRNMLQSWENRRKNVRLVAEIVRLVAEVVGDAIASGYDNISYGLFLEQM